MCYPKPGPRCSAHARQRLDTARDAYDAAVASNDLLHSQPDVDSDEQAGLAAEASAAAVSDAAITYARALKEWHSTPDGMRELEDKIVRLSDQPGAAQHLAHLEHDLLQGRTTRQHQIAEFAATRNPVTGLNNSDLKAELTDLIEHRMPTMADDPDGLVMEQARFNAVLDEITDRRANNTWRGGRDLPTPAPAAVSDDESPFAVSAEHADHSTPVRVSAAAHAPVTPPVPTQATDAWDIERGHVVYMPGEGQVRVMAFERREDPDRGIRFVEMDLHNPVTGETKTRRYAAGQMLQRVGFAVRPVA